MKDNLILFLDNPWVYFIGLFLAGSYYFFKRKFENLADKDDIADITREVESVKSEFNTDLEKLKVNLDVLKSNRINLINEKKKVIYEFWISLNNYNGKLDYFLSALIKSEVDKTDYLKTLDKDFDLMAEKSSLFSLVLHDEITNEMDEILSKLHDVFFIKEQVVRKNVNLFVELYLDYKDDESISDKLKILYEGIFDEKIDLNKKSAILLDEFKSKLHEVLRKLHAKN